MDNYACCIGADSGNELDTYSSRIEIDTGFLAVFFAFYHNSRMSEGMSI
jgi:hypothetical protein